MPKTAGETLKTLKAVVEKLPHVRTIVVDTINAIMTKEEMDILRNPGGRDAWADLASTIYELYQYIISIEKDIVVFVMAHIEPYDVNGFTHFRTKTNGKKLTKINLNGMLRYNLYAEVKPIDPPKFEYSLRTQSNGYDEARSPMGVFDYIISNDLEEVRKQIIESE